MHPQFFEIPFVHLTVKSYGMMMVVGFLVALPVIKHLSRDITPNPSYIINAALYSLIAGVVGARVFFVVHYFDQFRDRPLSVFSIWEGGLEFYGGLLAMVVILIYLRYHKLPIRHYLDIFAIGLMLALAFGRIGCFLNGCCFGKPTNLPWGVCFPYGSFTYRSQVHPNPQRGRPVPQLELPADFFGYRDENGRYWQDLKPLQELTAQQHELVTNGKYCCLPVHPTQLYSSAKAGLICILLYFFWKRSQRAERIGNFQGILTKPGSTFALAFVLYGVARFLMEFLRDDNPFEVDSLTVSQLIGILMVVLGVALIAVFAVSESEKVPVRAGRLSQNNRPERVVEDEESSGQKNTRRSQHRRKGNSPLT